jgi:hypothetical protein
MEVSEAIEKWSKSFGEKSLHILEQQEPDEDGQLFASFFLRSSIEETAAHFGVSEAQISREVISKAASECLLALLRAGYENVTISLEGDILVAVVEKTSTGFTLV